MKQTITITCKYALHIYSIGENMNSLHIHIGSSCMQLIMFKEISTIKKQMHVLKSTYQRRPWVCYLPLSSSRWHHVV